MEKNKLMELAIAELIAIKEHATQSEINLLIKAALESNIDGSSPSRCVYGIMTGLCWSDRAVELIEKCTSGIYFRWITRDGEQQEVQIKDPEGGRFYTPMERALCNHQEEVTEFIKEIFA